MTNEAATVLKAMQSLIDQSVQSYLCEKCWVYVQDGGEHACDPEERSLALLRVSQPSFFDPRRRAKGYGVH